jgi:site-specific DNA-methyltransferase (adenine-specific)
VPNKKNRGRAQAPAKRPKPFYKSPPPKPKGRAALLRRPNIAADPQVSPTDKDFVHAEIIPASHFELREDGSVQIEMGTDGVSPSQIKSDSQGQRHAVPPDLIFSADAPFLRLYHGNCLELLDAIHDKYGDAGRFDAIFADPPYFLSNGGISCHAGQMVKVDKGGWDKSRGAELNHEFNREWLKRCQRVLKPNGTIWITGTHHVIFSIGYAMQQLGYKILNDIAWEKPNPPPNLSCRYFTHSTETILWAAKNENSKHVFNYQAMRKVTGKQMKTVWRKDEFATETQRHRDEAANEKENDGRPQDLGDSVPLWQNPIWTMTAPGGDEKTFGKHPTQKPVALIERCLLASTNEGDLILDPFLGGGTTAIAAIKLNRGCVGIELDDAHARLAIIRADREIVLIWLRHYRVRMEIVICGRDSVPLSQIKMGRRHADPPTQIDLDLFSETINGSRCMADATPIETERIYHECKFVFLSCAQVERGSVVHTTVDVSLQEAWAKTPNGKKRETTHVVRCETEIFRVKSA